MFRTGLVAALATLALLACDPAAAQLQRRPTNPAFAKVVDNPDLPRVLLIGDSISIGYTVPVRKKLEGEANVHRIPTNGGPTTRGLAQIDAWLGDGHWDVIHFNWGLHDLKYMDEKGRLVDVTKGKQQVPLAEYEENLRKLVTPPQGNGGPPDLVRDHAGAARIRGTRAGRRGEVQRSGRPGHAGHGRRDQRSVRICQAAAERDSA